MSSYTDFYNRYGNAAIEAASGSGVFPITVLAAAAHESAFARSGLAAQYNNFFGIKAGSSWNGKIVNLKTKEVYDGKTVTIKAGFRYYDTPEDSFRDYVRLLSTTRYKNKGVLTAETPEEQITRVWQAGYATDPNYPGKVINIMKGFDLVSSANAKGVSQLRSKKKNHSTRP